MDKIATKNKAYPSLTRNLESNENIEPTEEDLGSEKVQQVKQIKFQNPKMIYCP